MTDVIVAAGGGGDAIAAAMVHTFVSGGAPLVIMTYAWERLRVDPVPGPRAARDFIGLGRFGQVGPATRVRPPSRSTLPRLASELEAEIVLLDPSGGAVGLREQIAATVGRVGADHVDVVDAGGDAVARGDEKELRSPLADALVIAACAGLGLPADLLVAGPGLDGELSDRQVIERIDALGGHRRGVLTASHAATFAAPLRWHPTEVTALLVAAAGGMRGRVEIRDGGTPVPLTDDGAAVYAVDLRTAFAGGLLAPALLEARSLADAEDVVREVCGSSEIDYERRKAARLDGPDLDLEPSGLVCRATDFAREARERGVDYVTLRRLAEAVAAPSIEVEALRRTLTERLPTHDAPPLWSVRAEASRGRA